MAGSCCSKPVARIIKVGSFEAGIVGLDVALQEAVDSMSMDDEHIATWLLSRVKTFGNYVAPGFETAYRKALLREYKLFRSRSSGNP